jgi:hypothetical protein
MTGTRSPLVAALTPDEYFGDRPLTVEQVYDLPYSPGDAARVAQLRGEFGWTYEQARSVAPSLADWFLAFRGEGL